RACCPPDAWSARVGPQPVGAAAEIPAPLLVVDPVGGVEAIEVLFLVFTETRIRRAPLPGRVDLDTIVFVVGPRIGKTEDRKVPDRPGVVVRLQEVVGCDRIQL